MESVLHIKTAEYFDVSEDDFDIFQDIFSKYNTSAIADAVTDFKLSPELVEKLSRIYTDDEIKSILVLDAEYTDIELDDEDTLYE